MTSLAEGLSLQGTPRDYTRDIIYKQKIVGAQKAQDKKDQNDLYNFDKDVFTDKSKYHRLLIPEVKKDTDQAMKDIMNAYSTDRNTFRFKGAEILNNLKSRLQTYRAQTDQWNQVEKLDPNTLTPPQKQFVGVLKTGQSVNDFSAIPEDKLGSVIHGQDGSIGFNYTLPKVDIQKQVNDQYNSALTNMLPVVSELGRIGNTNLIQEIQAIPDTKEDADKIGAEITSKLGRTVSVPFKHGAGGVLESVFSNPQNQIAFREMKRGDIESGKLQDNPESVFSEFSKTYGGGGVKQKVTERTIPQPKAPKSTAAERGMVASFDGVSYFNAKNKWTSINPTKLPEAYANLFRDKTGSAKNLSGAVAWNLSHPDAAGQENKTLNYSDKEGNAIQGVPETLVYYPHKDDGFIVVSVKTPKVNAHYKSATDKTVVNETPAGVKYEIVPLSKNRGKVSGENGFDPKDVYNAQTGGKPMTDGGEKKSSSKKYYSSDGTEVDITGAPQEKIDKYIKEGKLHLK